MKHIISRFRSVRQQFKLIHFVTSLFFVLQINSSLATTPEQKFSEGVKLYQEKKFQEAADAFQLALSLGSDNLNLVTDNKDILYNLGLTKFQLGQKGFAIGLLRHVVGLAPDNESTSSALRYMIQKLQVQEIAHEISIYESLRENVLSLFSLPHILFLNSILFIFIGMGIINYLARRRIAIKEEKELPQLSPIFILLLVVFIASSGLIALKIYDDQIPRGTIIAEKASVKSGPTEDSPEIYEIFEGLEVVINEEYNNWIQITYPGGLTGWLPKTAVMKTNISTSRLTKSLIQQ